MVHDRVASIVSLARTVLMGIDPAKAETSVPTPTLVLLVQTLIDVGQPNAHAKVADGANKSVLSVMASVNGVEGGKRG